MGKAISPSLLKGKRSVSGHALDTYFGWTPLCIALPYRIILSCQNP
jgi:hypothetical protein